MNKDGIKTKIDAVMSGNKIVVVFAAGFLIVYMLFVLYMQTAGYAAAQLKFAYKNNNNEILNRYIAMPTIVNSAYDDVTGDLFTAIPMKPETKKRFDLFYKLIKPDLCRGTLQMIADYLQEHRWPQPSRTSILKGRDMGIDYEELLTRSLLRSTKIKAIGSINTGTNGEKLLPLTVIDRYTGTEFELQLLMQPNDQGTWQVVKIINYHDYLTYVRNACQNDIRTYLENTKSKTTAYNKQFNGLQQQFKNMTKDFSYNMPGSNRSQLYAFIKNSIIPAYLSHENYLQQVNVPAGAQHLHILRLQSNAKTIIAWQDFAAGMKDKDKKKLSVAEKNYQEALVLEQKVSDIVNKMPALFVPDIQ
ncbi:hypothetical protein [Pectinatus brassicae]|uniref:Uncharacterized protein n=1 Tax=Pectinatus brassicae TaxID=862415 RepID=A0A840UWH7_9FIRM|nr:hypothetical protein [Pectinatus brassicae]MBB5337194.1 hypothetical protein [Pectinatus brassicae]